MFIGQFWLSGTHYEMIQHTWYDRLTDKYFWRAKMAEAGCNIPGALGNWDGKTLTMVDGHKKNTMKVLCKIPDSYLGIGDKIIEDVKLDEAGIQDLIETHLKKDFDGKKCIIMKFLLPTPKYGVH